MMSIEIKMTVPVIPPEFVIFFLLGYITGRGWTVVDPLIITALVKAVIA